MPISRVTQTHTYATTGNKTVTVTVTDKDGGAASNTFQVLVASTASTTSLTSSVNPSTFGQSITFTATVSPSSPTPSGTIQFTIDGVNFGTPVTLSGGSATSG